MPVPNDFRLNGALGGLVASEEYMDDQRKQELANLLTQAQTAQVNQATDEKSQLLPLLLQQRQYENEIKAKSALEARLGMANVPAQVANEAGDLRLHGMKTDNEISLLPQQQRLAEGNLALQGQQQKLQEALSKLMQVGTALETQGPAVAIPLARELGMDPSKLGDAKHVKMRIQQLSTLLAQTPQHAGEIEKENIKVGPAYARIAAEKEWRADAIKAKKDAEGKALDVERDFVKARDEWLKAGSPEEGPVAEKYKLAHFDYYMSENRRQAASMYIDPDTGQIVRDAPANRPIPDPIPKKNKGSADSKLTPEQRKQLVDDIRKAQGNGS